MRSLGSFVVGRHLNGYPDRAPVRPNISLGDSLAGLHAAFGAVMALHAQRRLGGAGQVPGSLSSKWVRYAGSNSNNVS